LEEWRDEPGARYDLAINDHPLHYSTIRLAFEVGGERFDNLGLFSISVTLCDGGFVVIGEEGRGAVDIVTRAFEKLGDGDGVVQICR